MAGIAIQRCTNHKLWNLLAKAPAHLREELAEDYRRMIYADSREAVHNAHTDYGVGVRLHSTRRTLVRLDVARSVEGYRALFAFTAPFRVPSPTVAPYAP